MSEQPLERALQREQERVSLLERTIDTLNRDLVTRQEQLRQSNAYLTGIVEAMTSALIVVDRDLSIEQINVTTSSLLGFTREELTGKPFTTILSMREISRLTGSAAHDRNKRTSIRTSLSRKDGAEVPVLLTMSVMRGEDPSSERLVCLAMDITEQQAMEAQLVQSQKLESVGQLAAGIAHELNTPIQYIRDNMHFLSTEFEKIVALLHSYDSAWQTCAEEQRRLIEESKAHIDLPFILAEMPLAISQTMEGAESVSRIVKALKEFSHPGTSERIDLDINKAIQSIATISRNEWKYVAELELVLDPSNPVAPCFVGELNQALLNIIVNAAHAVEDSLKNTRNSLGKITVSTERKGSFVEIRIRDSGTGIPEEIREKIFDPFFTTKEVGRGTGQGLSIAYTTIVKRHGGSLTFETKVNQGTTFIVQIPLSTPTS